MIEKKYFDLLLCPLCASRFRPLAISSEVNNDCQIECVANGHLFPVRNGVPRFMGTSTYADSFGFQWNKFRQIQLDSYNQTDFSEKRFRSITGWGQEDIAGKLTLDAGCGAGRFSEIAIKYGAELVAFDISGAVDAWKDNFSSSDAFVCQASIYEIPFVPASFDFVYCIGVLQHTPDPMSAVRSLCRMVKPGGKIGLWIYERDWKSYVGTLGFKYALRPFFARLSRSEQYLRCKVMVDYFFPLISLCKPMGLLGKLIMRLLPVASAHLQDVPLSIENFKNWVILDTFDMYSPAYDQPQTYEKIAKLLADEGFGDMTRHPHGGISITASRNRSKD